VFHGLLGTETVSTIDIIGWGKLNCRQKELKNVIGQ